MIQRKVPLKRSTKPIQRKTHLKRSSSLKTGTRTTKVPKKGKSASSVLKTRIQALIRLRVIERDGGCILRHYPDAGACGGYRGDGELILQGEHLNGRANSVSYGELDNIVCLCSHHHIFFKRQQPGRYWILVRKHIGEERWHKVEAWILDRSPHRSTKSDWERVVDNLI